MGDTGFEPVTPTVWRYWPIEPCCITLCQYGRQFGGNSS